MLYDIIHLINPIIGIAINVAVHITSFKYIVRLTLLNSIIIGFISGLFSILIIESYFASLGLIDFISRVVFNIIVYSSLSIFYFHFINLGETGRRIRILKELYNSEGGLRMEDIISKYNSEELIRKRLNRLISNRQVFFVNQRYFNTKSIMLFSTKIIDLLQLIIFKKRKQ